MLGLFDRFDRLRTKPLLNASDIDGGSGSAAATRRGRGRGRRGGRGCFLGALASQIAPACENFTIGTRAIFRWSREPLGDPSARAFEVFSTYKVGQDK